MQKLIYYVAASLDGFIATKHHSLDWLDAFQLGADATPYDAFYQNIGAIILGSKTYDWIMRQSPDNWPYKNLPAFVISNSQLIIPSHLDIHVTNHQAFELAAIAKQAADGKNVWLVGGGQTAASFADANVLDQIFLTTIPVFLGEGISVLPVNKVIRTVTHSQRILQSGALESIFDLK